MLERENQKLRELLMVKCTLNGTEIEVEEGTTIIEAYKKFEKEIAHYCWHPGLSVAGVCRLCMVKIEGNPRLQIACNTIVQDGMVITNQDDEVKDAVKWGLDFHLINHPLDCPICDQAGECGLQDQYMKFGQYVPEMAVSKVKKNKVVDLGDRVVLDSERCILCSRCVRFTSEVSKTDELGIFNRGDKSEIGTYENKPLNNNYSLNTVDICPVGALTSKDFRFQQRAWFLKDAPSVCNGCSTGCNVKMSYNDSGVWRVKPSYNGEVNGFWMCDKGRDVYKYVNPYADEVSGHRKNKKKTKKLMRLLFPQEVSGQKTKINSFEEIKKSFNLAINANENKKNAVVITAQYTNEEIEALVNYFKDQASVGLEQIYFWDNTKSDEGFDGLLYREGDLNPNTKGLKNIFEKHGIKTKWSNLESSLESNSFENIFIFGPENYSVFSDTNEKVAMFSKLKNTFWFSACWNDNFINATNKLHLIPLKTFVEKSGTFTNYKGIEQNFKKVTQIVEEALDLTEVISLFEGKLSFNKKSSSSFKVVNNEMLSMKGSI